MDRRTAHPRAARQDARRLVVDQRPHLQSRPARSTTTAGRSAATANWGYADVLPYFKRLERRIGEGDETFRGREGGLTITDIDYIIR